MTDDRRAALLAMIDGKQLDEVVMVPAGWLRAALTESPVTPPGEVEIDLTCEEVGALLKRDASLIRLWCRAGLFPNAYKLMGREWRIPRESIASFQRDQRPAP